MSEYESNVMFRFLAGKLGPCRAVPAQAAFEILLALAISLLIGRGSTAASLASVAGVFGLAHLLAWHSNKRFLASRT